MSTPDRTPWRAATLLAAAAFLIAALVLVLLRPLMPIDETRYVTVAWEMWQGGSKLVPHLNGEIYAHKPPLLFWLINAVWSVTGVSALAARMVAPAFGAIAILLTALLARALWPDAPRRAGIAALMLATGGVFLLYGSTTMFDSMLTVAVLAAMLALVRLRHMPSLGPAVGLGAALALGVFAKGPVILIHVLPVALLMPLWADKATRPGFGLWAGRLSIALLVALVLVSVWLGPALVLGGAEYRADVLWRQSAGRIVASFAHQKPQWFYLALIPLLLWPWGWTGKGLSALAPRHVLSDEAGRMLAVWALGALIAFSLISGKQAHYLLPELPALALLLSAAMPEGRTASPVRGLLLLPSLLIFGLALATALNRLPEATAAGMAVPLPALAAGAVVLALLLIAVWRLRTDSTLTLIVAPATLLMAHLLAFPVMRDVFDTTPLATELAANEPQGLAMAMQEYHGEFSFTGRLTAPVAVLSSAAEVAAWAQAHPGGSVITRADLALPLTRSQIFRGRDYRLYTAP